MSLEIFLLILWLHFAADFLLQTDWMAINKSKAIPPLLVHTVVYSVPFLVFGWKYAAINGLLHGMTDFVTSRATSRLWKAGERHWFFVVIGLDQALHMTALIGTYFWLFGGGNGI